MSFDIDKDEYWEAINNGDYKWIWAAIEDLISQNKKLHIESKQLRGFVEEFADKPCTNWEHIDKRANPFGSLCGETCDPCVAREALKGG